MHAVVNGAASKAFLNLDATARKMIDAAVAVTTGQLGLSTPADTLELLQQGDARAVTPFRRELARQIAGAILMLDEHVDAVFEDRAGARTNAHRLELRSPFRMWVIARLRTATLYERLHALNQALVQALATLGSSGTTLLVKTMVIDVRDSYLLCSGQQQEDGVPLLLASRQ